MNRRYLKWNEINTNWSSLEKIWIDISIIENVAKVVRGSGGYKEFLNNPWERISKKIGEEDTEKFVKIFCTINDIEYEEGKFIKNNTKVTASQFNKVFEESKIKIEIKI